jgi:precorrin-6B methylase 2
MFHEVTLVQVSKSMPLAGGFMLKPLDPVFIITGGCS